MPKSGSNFRSYAYVGALETFASTGQEQFEKNEAHDNMDMRLWRFFLSARVEPTSVFGPFRALYYDDDKLSSNASRNRRSDTATAVRAAAGLRYWRPSRVFGDFYLGQQSD